MPKKTKMFKTFVCITDKEHAWLLEQADKTGLSMSELIRRLLDKEMERVG